MVSTQTTATCIAACRPLGSVMILANGSILAKSCLSSTFKSQSSGGMGASSMLLDTAMEDLGPAFKCESQL